MIGFFNAHSDYALSVTVLNGIIDQIPEHRIDHFTVSDTDNFTVNSAGIISNITNLIVIVYSLEIRAYDLSNNYCTITISITVEDTTNPTWDEIPSDHSFKC